MIKALVSLISIIFVFQSVVAEPDKGDVPIPNEDAYPEIVKKGQSIYNNTCLFCHGSKGKGARAPSLVTGPYAPGGGNTDEYMFDVIKNGRSGTIMGSFDETLTDEEIRDVIAYLRHEAKQQASK